MHSVYLVVSGEFILDTGDVVHENKLQPFRNPLVANCYHLSSGSILGIKQYVVSDSSCDSLLLW